MLFTMLLYYASYDLRLGNYLNTSFYLQIWYFLFMVTPKTIIFIISHSYKQQKLIDLWMEVCVDSLSISSHMKGCHAYRILDSSFKYSEPGNTSRSLSTQLLSRALLKRLPLFLSEGKSLDSAGKIQNANSHSAKITGDCLSSEGRSGSWTWLDMRQRRGNGVNVNPIRLCILARR